jgi:hypothetical protein
MQRNCPVCSSWENTLIFHDHNRREGYVELEGDYVICNDCGMRYLTQIPSFEEMWGKYEDIYVEPNIESLRSRLKKDTISNNKKILDIWCNHGIQLHSYYNSWWEVYGIDLNEKAIHDVQKYLPKEKFSVTTIEDASFKENFFDKVQTFHVLEHVYNPWEFLTKARSVLKNDWELEIRIPNGKSLEMLLWWKYASQSWIPFHVNLFEPKTIRQILLDAWFRDVQISTNPLPWWWILSFRQWRGTISKGKWVTNFDQNIFHKWIQLLLYPLLWIIAKVRYGEELHIFAKK